MNVFNLRWLLVTLLFICSHKICAQRTPLANFKLFFEKVYLHTDRELYAAGDTLWYKAYLTDAQTGELAITSANLYVEIISPANNIISRQTILLTGGLGYADISLPDTLISGNYRLRAYTNWMRNFGDDFIFEKLITLTGSSTVLASTGKNKKIADNTNIKSNTVNNKTDLIVPVTATFYPEGGSMVKGVNSLVAVKVEALLPNVDFQLVKGIITDAAGKTVAQFNCDTLGMARFNLRPLSIMPYQAVITYAGKSYSFKLPPALTSGLALKIVRYGSNVKAVISCDETTLQTMRGQPLTLLGKHGGKIYITETINLTAVKDSIDIASEVLPEGIASLTLYDTQKRPQAERLIYIESTENLRLDIATNKPVYEPKEKVNVSIRLTNEFYRPVKANLSFAAVNSNEAGEPESDIKAYMLLQSELKGPLNQVYRYFDTTNVNRLQQLDQLLLTQGWRNYVWRHMIDTNIAINYAPEQGFSLSGRLRQKFANKPLINKRVVATLLQGRLDSHMYLAITDSVGKYRFDKLHVKGTRNVELSALNENLSSTGWLLVDSIKADILPVKPLPPPPMAIAQQQLAVVQNKASKQWQAIRNSSIIKLKEVDVKKERIATSPNYAAQTYAPDQVFNITPKDHSYKTLQWYLLQNLKGAMTSNTDTISGIVIPGVISTPPGQPERMLISPLLSVDGRENLYEETSAEADRKVIYDLPIESVTKIVFKHLYGILFKPEKYTSMTLKQGDIYVLELTLKPGALKRPDVTKTSMEINGYYQAREFYKPIYNNPANIKTPDYRTTIHWEPMLQTSALGRTDVSFFNADSSGKMQIIVQGITETGKPVIAVSNYVVK
ncbi:MG2 domain-containing protein [Mucilaginibacter galii]|uniref:Macroglobulin domain-containing protein n=1 Tax=Mucilaginibacter galii TaxID=2005073 RepID=A0A917J8N6_9SPHI|nr:MG2 domain-containing protein [Mucilaginibacter galii]GGI49952.1 hypothetical protein GCM10011425_11640 [Mucilaginibacter galii]